MRVPPPVGWTRDGPRRYFAQPYQAGEVAGWIARNIAGPSRRYADLTPWVPSGTCANAITPALTLGFVGDVLPLRDRPFRVADEIVTFFQDVDLLVANFEGTLVEGRTPRVFMGQRHTETVLDLLAALAPPERTVLTCANNHAADFGWERFDRSYERLAARGFAAIGRADEPAIMIGGQVLLAAATAWSNRPCGYVRRLGHGDEFAAKDVAFRILCPHWGYELRAYPHPAQIAQASGLLDRWDMIVGHHSHCPQPVTLYERAAERRLVAYSLGNFTFGWNARHHLRGLALKVELGPDATGRWAVGRLEWRETAIRFASPSPEISLVTASRRRSRRSAASTSR